VLHSQKIPPFPPWIAILHLSPLFCGISSSVTCVNVLCAAVSSPSKVSKPLLPCFPSLYFNHFRLPLVSRPHLYIWRLLPVSYNKISSSHQTAGLLPTFFPPSQVSPPERCCTPRIRCSPWTALYFTIRASSQPPCQTGGSSFFPLMGKNGLSCLQRSPSQIRHDQFPRFAPTGQSYTQLPRFLTLLCRHLRPSFSWK